MGAMEGGLQKCISNEGLYQVEEAQYVNGSRSYNFKPKNNLPTHYTPALRNHESFLMEVECSGVQDKCRTFSRSMLHKVSKDSSNKAAKGLKTRAEEGPILLRIRC